MVEPVSLVSGLGAVYTLGFATKGKIENILNRDEYSDDLEQLEEIFKEALRTHLADTLTTIDDIETEDIDDGWEDIAEELDGLDAAFESERAAIIRITDAIGTGLGLNFEDNPQLRGRIEVAVAGAYRESMHLFFERVEGTDLGKTLEREVDIKIAEAVDAIDSSLTTIKQRIHRQEDAALRNKGFDRLDPLYFRRRDPHDPITSWRTGFDLVDVAAGYALDRQRPADEDGERQLITEQVIGRLQDGENVAVVGDPGSGKSTVCKQVAHRWHDLGIGEVFYRESEGAPQFDGRGTLINAIRAAGGEVLVVSEDAADEEVTEFYRVVKEFQNHPDVSFVVDARKSEWEAADDRHGSAGLESMRASFREVAMPLFDREETRRMIAHFEFVTDSEVRRSLDQLFKDVKRADVGRPLFLSHELIQSVLGESQVPAGVSAFEFEVREAFRKMDNVGDNKKLSHLIGMMINILNVVHVPVYPVFLHALSEDEDDRWQTKEVLDEIEGSMIVADEDPEIYRTFHEQWSVLYLERAKEELGDLAPPLVQKCVETLSNLFDIVQTETDNLSTEVQISRFARRTIRGLARVGHEHPSLAPLFQDIDPTAEFDFSTETLVQWHDYRGLMYQKSGEWNKAETEFKRIDELIGEINEESSYREKRWKAWNTLHKAGLANEQEDTERAKSLYEDSRDLGQEIGEKFVEAASLMQLASFAQEENQLQQARRQIQRAKQLYLDMNMNYGLLPANLNLTLIELADGNIEQAIDHLKEGSENASELGWEEFAEHIRKFSTLLESHQAIREELGDEYDEKFGDLFDDLFDELF